MKNPLDSQEASGGLAFTRSSRRLLPAVLLVCGAALASAAWAHDDSGWTDSDRHVVGIGHDVELGKSEKAEVVVSVLGSATVDGDVDDSVVAVIGDARVTGDVGDSAVAVLGDAYIDGKIDGDVVAILGNVRLGPQADVRGQVVEILGTVERSPTAVIEGGTVGVFSGLFSGAAGLRAWIHRCLFYARPLAPDPRLGWAWGVAFATLALYLLIAALFRDGLQRCVRTLDAHPGQSVLAALIATLLVPVLLIALAITVVGIALIPFIWVGLLCVGLFGRVVALGWLGGRCLSIVKVDTAVSAVINVLLGGVLALALYMIPALGFLLYMLLGVLGFGAVVYTLVLAARASRGRPMEAGHAAMGAATPPGMGAPPPGSAQSPGGTPFAGAPSAGAEADGAAPGGAPGPRQWWSASVDPLSAATLPRAGFWIRMGALLLDLVLVGFALSLFYHGARGTLIVLAAYAAIMWKMRGTTIGGIVCDLQVARIDGRPIEWETAIVRALACFLSLVVFGLGFLWIALDPERQAWHDKIAGTVVVRVTKGMALV